MDIPTSGERELAWLCMCGLADAGAIIVQPAQILGIMKALRYASCKGKQSAGKLLKSPSGNGSARAS